MLGVFVYLYANLWTNPKYVAVRHPDIVVDTIDRLLVKMTKAGASQDSKNVLRVIRSDLHGTRDAAASGGFALLWFLILLTTVVLVVTLVHLGCRYGSDMAMGDMCDAAEQTGVLRQVDGLYKIMLP